MPTWPLSLPGRDISLRLTRAGGSIRSATDGGVAQVRRRFTKEVETYSESYVFTSGDKFTFDSFWDMIGNGAFGFDREHPHTGNVENARIIEYPSFRLLTRNASETYWRVAMNVEYLP